MTIEQMNEAVDKVMSSITGSIGDEANVPIWTGRLRSAIKVRPASYGYDVYIDDGGMTEEDWNEMFGFFGGQQNAPWGVAPYAGTVEERKPYWRRVAMVIHDRLRRELQANFTTNYNPRGRGE